RQENEECRSPGHLRCNDLTYRAAPITFDSFTFDEPICETSRRRGGEMRFLTLLFMFCRDEMGQDLIEYSLLVAFVVLVSVAFFLGAGKNVMGAWDEGSEVLDS